MKPFKQILSLVMLQRSVKNSFYKVLLFNMDNKWIWWNWKMKVVNKERIVIWLERGDMKNWVDFHCCRKLKPIRNIDGNLSDRKWSNETRRNFLDCCCTCNWEILDRKKNLIVKIESLQSAMLVSNRRLLLLSCL